MGSHRARHRSDRKQSEELATDLLARLASEARPPRPRTASHLPLDPFATAPLPARPARPGPQNLVLAGSGATRCSGSARRSSTPFVPTPLTAEPEPLLAEAPSAVELADGTPADEVGLDAQTSVARRDDHVSTDTPVGGFPVDPSAPFPIDLTEADAEAPAGLAEPLADAVRTGGSRRAKLRRPLYATVSVSVISATAAVAASAGPAAFTPANNAPELPAQSAAAGAAALSLALPAAGSTHGTPPAVSAPGAQAQASAIVARAAADAKALGATQAGQAAVAAAANIPAHVAPPKAVAKPVPAHVPRPTPKTTTAPAAPAGSGMGTRVLALAKSKLGDPYVWGAAGPNAFDCSGIVVWAFKQLGISLPHSSATLSTMGTPVAKGALQPGDLVFFYSPVSHVGIYAGNGMVLNATQSGEPVQYTKLAYLPFHNARRITK
jgi:cell wall-associated NlpC family hydrolase